MDYGIGAPASTSCSEPWGPKTKPTRGGVPFSRDSDEELELLDEELGDDDEEDEELELDDDEELDEELLDDELELPSDQFLLRCGLLRPASRSLMMFPWMNSFWYLGAFNA